MASLETKMSSLEILPLEQPLNLAFGVEIEFLMLANKPSGYYSSLQSLISQGISKKDTTKAAENGVKIHARREFAAAFQRAGLSSRVTQNPRDFSKRDWMIKPEPDLELEEVVPIPEVKGQDISTYPRPDKRKSPSEYKFVVVDFEVNTPVLDFEDPDSFQTLAKGLEVIGSFSTAYATDGCAIHVHFSGNFTLETLKNVLYLVCLCERPLSQFHWSDRLRSESCRPCTLMFNKADRHFESIVKTISDFRSVPELVRWASTVRHYRDQPQDKQILDRTLAFNWVNLLEGRQKQTLEVRVHKASLCFEEIARWIQTVGLLISLCHNLPDSVFLDIGRQVHRKPEYGAMNLLHDLGLSDLELQWRNYIYHWTDSDLEEFASDVDLYDGLD